MTLLSVSLQESMIQATGGVTVTHRDESTYGHLEDVPVERLQGDGGGVLGTEPSVVIATGSLSAITVRKGINERLTVDGTLYYIREILTGDLDGGLLRLMLSEVSRG